MSMANTAPGGHPAAPPGGPSRRRAAVRRWAALLTVAAVLLVLVVIAVAAGWAGWLIHLTGPAWRWIIRWWQVLAVLATAVGTALTVYIAVLTSRRTRLETRNLETVIVGDGSVIVSGDHSAIRIGVHRSVPRAVNTLLHTGGAPVGRDRPLEPGGDYELLVNLGPYDPRSLVMDAEEANFDSTLLPPTSTGHWLDVVVSGGEGWIDGSRRRALFLPLRGSSWVCGCAPGGRHECAEQARAPYVSVPLRMPARACVVAVEVAIYYGAAVVHAQALTLPVGVPGASGPFAKVTYSLTSSFASLGDFAERSMSVLLDADHDGNHRMYVNGVRLAPFTFNLSHDAAFNAMSRARELLFRAHLYEQDGKWYSHYDNARQTKADDEYEQDLRQLAKAGAELFAALFPDPDDSRALQQMLAHEAQARGRAPVVQLAQSTQSQPMVPWQLVYDLDVGSDPDRYQPCPSVLEWGPRRPEGVRIPARCPHQERHGEEPLCPFGFWGFAHVLEVPPSVTTELAHVVSEDHSQIATVVAASSTLDAEETARHLEALETLGGVEPPLERVAALRKRLGSSDMDVVYLYCHGGRNEPTGATAADPVLELGPDRRDRFQPLDVSMWARKWARDHWRSRHPVVVLNGCHTAEMLPDTLAGFVVGFVAARAAGVIGTEVSLDQRFAGTAMELFLDDLHAGASVGQAMRHMRWELLSRGNIMGLAYSPYCAATLALRRAGRWQSLAELASPQAG
jgi:CHAT domain